MTATIHPLPGIALRHAARVAAAMDLLARCADDVAATAYGTPHGIDQPEKLARVHGFMEMLDLIEGR